MDDTAPVRQLLETTKAAFDTSFHGMALLQEQAERAAEAFLAQASWLPPEGAKAMGEWIASCRKGRADYKAAVDAGYARVLELLAGRGTP